MLVEPKLKILQELVESSSKEELIWINGYLAGVVSNGISHQKNGHAPVKAAVDKITIVYGTETGNAKKLSTDFATKAKKNGIKVKLTGLDQYRINDLTKEEYLFIVISTQGEGEPPLSAQKFYDHIHKNELRFEKLKYGVLALGDTSYPLFCKAGEDVDVQLERLGGHKVIPTLKADTDYEDIANEWFGKVFQQLQTNGSSAPDLAPAVVKKSGGKKNYTGKILSCINLNGSGSKKETYHIEIEAEDAIYQPGDSIGIIPENEGLAVEEILAFTGINPTKQLEYKDELVDVNGLLRNKLNIVHLPERVVKKYAEVTQHDIPAIRFDLIDLLKIYPVKDESQFEAVIAVLEPITPRLYSIASSPEAHGGEIHLTVAKDTFMVEALEKCGVCSDFLSRQAEDAPLSFYVHKNLQFRLPAEDKDVIMIGPGTGIAPFRSFMAERDATGASGRNWLFFGDQHFQTDFLYQTEIQTLAETGVLTRVNTAFSRDQKEKIYVQHKMLRNGAAFYEWLESGAYVYVCGAKDPMGLDVEYTLLQIIQEFGGHTAEEANSYLNDMKTEGRYLKDVY